ncbi:hypothetical protein MC28_E099 (plasmid) [Bacillus thuringiensis MC28]|nr:hypothetical protein MC28_E099 [Bacillus thuringiensis MC28]
MTLAAIERVVPAFPISDWNFRNAIKSCSVKARFSLFFPSLTLINL